MAQYHAYHPVLMVSKMLDLTFGSATLGLEPAPLYWLAHAIYHCTKQWPLTKWFCYLLMHIHGHSRNFRVYERKHSENDTSRGETYRRTLDSSVSKSILKRIPTETRV